MLSSQRRRNRVKRHNRIRDLEQGAATSIDVEDSPKPEAQPNLISDSVAETNAVKSNLPPAGVVPLSSEDKIIEPQRGGRQESIVVTDPRLGEPTFGLGDEQDSPEPWRSLLDPTGETKAGEDSNRRSVYPDEPAPSFNKSSISLDKTSIDQPQRRGRRETHDGYRSNTTTETDNEKGAPVGSVAFSARPAVQLPIALEANQIFTEDLYSRIDERVREKNNRIRTSPIWKTYVTDADREDKEAMTLWMDNLDNLLVFAGLFSAILTAFLVLSSANLKPDPLDTISSQISKLTIIASSLGTIPDIPSDDPFAPSQRALRVNFLWFISLSFAILAAAGAMLAKSWCLEYSRESSVGTPFEQAQRRQRRYNGLLEWKFQEIVDFLPALLYVSIILFMIGICDYLVDFHVGLAITTIIIFASGLGFALLTIIASVMYDNCPFRVPLLEAVRHMLRSWSPSRQDTMRTPTVLEFALLSAGTGSTGIRRVLQRATEAIQHAAHPLFSRASTYIIHLHSFFSENFHQINQQIHQLFPWIWDSRSSEVKRGMDFVEEPNDSKDQTVVDAIRWIIQSSADPTIVTAALSLIPVSLRSPQHHLQLIEAGACWEMLRRFYDLTQLQGSLSAELESVRAKQLAGLIDLFNFLMSPLDRWGAHQFRYWDPANELFDGYAISVSEDLERSVDPALTAFSISAGDLVNGSGFTLRSMDEAFSTPFTPSAAIGWLRAVRDWPGSRGNSKKLVNLNRILRHCWQNIGIHDRQVQYAYISAITSYLGYTDNHTRPNLPSYRACIYYCLEKLPHIWATTQDPDMLQTVGIVAVIAVPQALYYMDSPTTQMERSFERLMVSMSTFWDNYIDHRLAALRTVRDFFDTRPEATKLLLSHILQLCSSLLVNPESWDAASQLKIKAVVSFFTDWETDVDSEVSREVRTLLARLRLSLSQVMQDPMNTQMFSETKEAIDRDIRDLSQPSQLAYGSVMTRLSDSVSQRISSRDGTQPGSELDSGADL